jgi:hypothetical protein
MILFCGTVKEICATAICPRLSSSKLFHILRHGMCLEAENSRKTGGFFY